MGIEGVQSWAATNCQLNLQLASLESPHLADLKSWLKKEVCLRREYLIKICSIRILPLLKAFSVPLYRPLLDSVLHQGWYLEDDIGNKSKYRKWLKRFTYSLKKVVPNCNNNTWGRPCSWTSKIPSTLRLIPTLSNSSLIRWKRAGTDGSLSNKGSLVPNV